MMDVSATDGAVGIAFLLLVVDHFALLCNHGLLHSFHLCLELSVKSTAVFPLGLRHSSVALGGAKI